MVSLNFWKKVCQLKLLMFVKIQVANDKKFNWIWHEKARIHSIISIRGYYKWPTITCLSFTFKKRIWIQIFVSVLVFRIFRISSFPRFPNECCSWVSRDRCLCPRFESCSGLWYQSFRVRNNLSLFISTYMALTDTICCINNILISVIQVLVWWMIAGWAYLSLI